MFRSSQRQELFENVTKVQLLNQFNRPNLQVHFFLCCMLAGRLRHGLPPRWSNSNSRLLLQNKGKSSPHSISVLRSEMKMVSRQRAHSWLSHKHSGRLSLLAVRRTVTFPEAQYHHPSAGTKVRCLVMEMHVCEQLAQSCYMKVVTTQHKKLHRNLPAKFYIAV